MPRAFRFKPGIRFDCCCEEEELHHCSSIFKCHVINDFNVLGSESAMTLNIQQDLVA